MSTKPKPRRVVLGRDPVDQLYRSVLRYVKARGGTVLVIGGIEVQDFGEGTGKYRVAIRCLGRAPVPPDPPKPKRGKR